jgi:integrase/recombinase XerC
MLILSALKFKPLYSLFNQLSGRFFLILKRLLILRVYCLYFLELRINELATHQMRHFRKVNQAWWFYVVGKGSKAAKIPVNDDLLLTLADYRLLLGLAIEPASDDEHPLVQHYQNNKPLSVRAISHELKTLAKLAAEQFVGEPHRADKLRKFSAHWLRHLSASVQDRHGIKMTHIKDNLRHGEEATTLIYVHTSDNEWRESMQRLTLRFEN